MLFATLQGATAALVDPCGKSANPAVEPLAVKTGATYPPVSVEVTVVPLSVMDDAPKVSLLDETTVFGTTLLAGIADVRKLATMQSAPLQ